MRGILGGIVFIGGVGALGWFASAGIAPQIEEAMGAAAEAEAEGAIHAVSVDVSGRDVTVSGLVDSEEERAEIIAALAEVPGQRVIRDELEVLPPATPFTLTIERDGDALAIEGFVPTEADRARLAEAIGPGASVLTLASGAPDDAWTDAAIAGFEALAALKSGALSISDADLTLTGLAATPVEDAAAKTALAALPEGYGATIDLDVEDDGRPFALIIDYVRGGTATATGKLPVTMTADVLTALEADLISDGLAIARIPSEDGQWPAGAAGFIAALAALEEGALTLTDRTGTLMGVGTRAGIVAAEEVLASLPASFTAATEFTLFDDGAPLRLSAEKTESGTEISGKLPFGAAPEALGLDAFGAQIAIAEIDARTPDFLALAAQGLAALADTREGTLTVEDA
ncbi:MAG: BON domain-containing protein, partial [Pseudomonadota bacterium]